MFRRKRATTKNRQVTKTQNEVAAVDACKTRKGSAEMMGREEEEAEEEGKMPQLKRLQLLAIG